MSRFNCSYLLGDNEIPPFVLGAFVSRSQFKGDYIYAETSFKSSRFAGSFNLEEYKAVYLDKLNSISKPFTWELVGTSATSFKARLFIKNDLGLDKERFFYKLYYKTVNSFWILEDGLNAEKKMFMRGFFETRGSIDTTANYISQDYYYDNSFETKKYKIFTDFCDVPYYVLNLNFRNLQKQYCDGTNMRNAQFRINSIWYMKYVGMMNDYKVEIYANSHSTRDKIVTSRDVSYFNVTEPSYNLSSGVDDKFNFYVHNILKHDLSEDKIANLRRTLGFDKKSKSPRDPSLRDFIMELEPDECVCCKGLYDISARTFTQKRTNRPYFEVHHVISLGKNKELDDENNLVKLCPVCHTCLDRGKGLEEDQKQLIRNIFRNAPKTFEFSRKILDCDDFEILVDMVFKNLK